MSSRDDPSHESWYLSKFSFYWLARPRRPPRPSPRRVSAYVSYNVRGLSGTTFRPGSFLLVNFSCGTCVYLPTLRLTGKVYLKLDVSCYSTLRATLYLIMLLLRGGVSILSRIVISCRRNIRNSHVISKLWT